MPLRVPADVEIEGLDIAETGVLAYPEFPIYGRGAARPRSLAIDEGQSQLER